MNKDLLGLGGEVPPGQEAVRLFDPSGTFATDVPYLLADGRSLIAPLPATVTDEATYVASDGSLQSSWGEGGLTPPVEYLWVLESGTWGADKYWLVDREWDDVALMGVTNQGEQVTHNGEPVTHGT